MTDFIFYDDAYVEIVKRRAKLKSGKFVELEIFRVNIDDFSDDDDFFTTTLATFSDLESAKEFALKWNYPDKFISFSEKFQLDLKMKIIIKSVLTNWNKNNKK